MTLKLRATPSHDPSGDVSRDRIPVICWLNGAVEVLIPGEGGRAHWKSAEPANSPDSLARAVRCIRVELGLPMTKAILVLSHGNLGLLQVETPPAPERTLQVLIAREVERQKNFSGEATWVSRPRSEEQDGSPRTVHFCPTELKGELVSLLGAIGLSLCAIVPFSEVLVNVASEIGGAVRANQLVVASLEGVVTLTLHDQGRPALHRQIQVSSSDRERVGQEIRRTLLFASQHLGLDVNELCLLGGGRWAESVEGPRKPEGLVIREGSSLGMKPWLEWISRNGVAQEMNLLAANRAEVGERPVLSPRWIRIGGASALVVALALAIALERLGAVERSTQKRLGQEQSVWAGHIEGARKAAIREEQRNVVRQKWAENQRSTCPVRLILVLGEILPEPVVLTNVQISGESNGWRVRLTGTARDRTASIPGDTLSRVNLALSESPWGWITRAGEGHAQAAQVRPQVESNWSRRLQERATAPDPGPWRFQLEGVLP